MTDERIAGGVTPVDALRAAAQQALEALETLVPRRGGDEYSRAAAALRAALAQQAETMAQEAAQEALQGADVLAEHPAHGAARRWASVGCWLHPGERIVVLRG